MTARIAGAALVAALSILLCASAGPDDADTPVFEVPADGRIAIQVNGHPATALATPGMPSDLNLSRRFAASIFGAQAEQFSDDHAGFKLFSVKRATGVRIGPARVLGNLRSVDLAWPTGHATASARWFATDAYDEAAIDARIGPYALPVPVVRFTLRPEVPGESVTELPLARRGAWWLATTSLEVGGKTVYLALAPQYPTTIASAAAGAAIGAAHDGRFTAAPVRVMISHGVDRPARRMALGQPFSVGALRIGSLLVRTRDYGSAAAIADVTAPDPSETDEDVVVRGKSAGSRASYVVYVGADALKHCSSVTYDKVARVIRLSCLP